VKRGEERRGRGMGRAHGAARTGLVLALVEVEQDGQDQLDDAWTLHRIGNELLGGIGRGGSRGVRRWRKMGSGRGEAGRKV